MHKPPGTPSSTNSLVKIDNDGTVWIGSIKYQPAPKAEPVKAALADVNVEAAKTAADHGEYSDWAYTNSDPNWSVDMATFLLAANNVSSFLNEDPPLYPDSGVSTHISCV